MKVLVADDDPLTRAAILNILKKGNFEVVTAGNGAEAWDILCGDDPPRIAILDWMMPEMTGLELCRQVKNADALPYTYILLLTSKSDKEDVVEGLDAGADDFLSKPASPRELRSRLRVGVRAVENERVLREKNRELLIYRRAFEDSVQEMLITAPDGSILDVNPSCARKYGYTPDELIGRDAHVLSETPEGYIQLGVSPEEHARMFRNLSESVRDPNKGHWQGTVVNHTRDGRIVWSQLHVSAIRDAAGDIVAFVSAPVDITERVEQEAAIRLECYRAITELAEARDQETGQHLKRLSEYSRMMAIELGLPRKFVEDIANFAPLHDVGKVGIPDEILLAPRRLSEDEFATMKGHTSIGHEILKDRPTLEMAAEIAVSHHEKWDGSGYPHGLKGEDIPLSGRIVAVADVYDALRSDRPYKKGWSHEEAVAMIEEGAGSHFDPALVEIFVRIQEGICRAFDENADVAE